METWNEIKVFFDLEFCGLLTYYPGIKIGLNLHKMYTTAAAAAEEAFKAYFLFSSLVQIKKI